MRFESDEVPNVPLTITFGDSKLGVPMLLAPDTIGAAQHAVEQGYISEASLSEITIEKAQDAAAPTPTEKIIDKGLPGNSKN